MFPKEAGQTKSATTATAQDDQASKYDQNQDYVGNSRSDDIKCAGIALGRLTAELRRVPCRADLWTRQVKWVRDYKDWSFTSTISVTNHVDTRFGVFYRSERKNLLRKWNPMPVTHTVIVSATTALFLFQIAMLAALVSI